MFSLPVFLQTDSRGTPMVGDRRVSGHDDRFPGHGPHQHGLGNLSDRFGPLRGADRSIVIAASLVLRAWRPRCSPFSSRSG